MAVGQLRRVLHFPYFPLRLVSAGTTGDVVKEVAFKTVPQATKVEIKRLLEAVYGLKVARVDTANFEGKKKVSAFGFFRRSDFKKVYVTLKEPVSIKGIQGLQQQQ